MNIFEMQIIDGKIQEEVLKRADFEIKVSHIHDDIFHVHPDNIEKLQDLYKEVTKEFMSKLIPDTNELEKLSNHFNIIN